MAKPESLEGKIEAFHRRLTFQEDVWKGTMIQMQQRLNEQDRKIWDMQVELYGSKERVPRNDLLKKKPLPTRTSKVRVRKR